MTFKNFLQKNLTHIKGSKAENLAIEYLKKSGYTIIEKNFHSRFGEIDIIAKDKDYYVFVEVRFRKNNSFGSPIETVNIFKKRKIYKASIDYVKRKKLENCNLRFDVVSIEGEKINLLKNAFAINDL